MKSFAIFFLSFALFASESYEVAPAQIKAYTFKAGSGEEVAAEWGTFEAPENRSKPDGKRITLAFVRFPSTNPNPGYPIVYLAGGPGGSGIATARGRRFPLFMALREVADVIAFDQRGTGASNHIPACETELFPPERALNLEEAVAFQNAGAEKCRRFWAEQGVDLSGYNTWESAADLNDLRRAIGAEKLNLWGISYGTHLAFAAMKRMEPRIHRAVLASSEGPDHTVKLPGWSDAFFHRVQQVVWADPEARAKYPDFVGSVRRVFDRLDREPVKVPLTLKSGEPPITLTLGKEVIQVLVSYSLIKNPENISMLPATFAELEAGRFERIANFVYQAFLARPGRYRGMPEATDAASGISTERLSRFRLQAERSILGEVLNFPFPHLFKAFEIPDLGESFRKNVETSIPTLFLNGTLDGRTFPEETWELMRGFENGFQIIVENGGHDLFMIHPEVGEAVVRFFKEGRIQKSLIHAPPPKFR